VVEKGLKGEGLGWVCSSGVRGAGGIAIEMAGPTEIPARLQGRPEG
jgi:hypothetical protein